MQQASQEQISLPEHLERYLGTIHRGWQDTATDSGIQVVSFANQPEEGVTTFVTLGLSRSILNLGDIRTIREELITSASNALSPDSVAGFLLSVAEDSQRSKRALLRGEVLGPGQPVTSEATLTAVYVANPSPFHPALTDFESEPPAIIFAYLIPISGQEASLIQSHGWRWFEAELENQNPDVWDWARTTDVVCGH